MITVIKNEVLQEGILDEHNELTEFRRIAHDTTYYAELMLSIDDLEKGHVFAKELIEE